MPALLRSPRGLVSALAWSVLVLVSAYAWYLTGQGLAFRLGLGEAAGGLGVASGAAVALTLVRWARGDAEGRALADLRCPSCSAALETRHEHAQASMGGRQLWSCAACGFEKMAPLTCEGCAA
jgi:hypothetical protein